MIDDIGLGAIRRRLMLDLACLPGEGDVLTWQRRLADEIIAAESGGTGTSPDDLKRHRRLLRVLADGLVHRLVEPHTIRTLSKHPGKPPSLTAQGANLDFAFECAADMRSAGLIPIIADLTTLIGVGDLVGVSPQGVVVLECKNTTMPTRTSSWGRLARQRERGESAETYLTTSRLENTDGTVLQAFNFDLPDPDFASVASLLERCCATEGAVAIHDFAANDRLLACTLQTPPDAIAAAMPRQPHADIPVMTFLSEVRHRSSHRLWSTSSYPLPGETRHRLLEGEIQLIRFVDLGALAATVEHGGRRATLTPRMTPDGAEVVLAVDGADAIVVTTEMLNVCLYMPVSLAAMRAALLELAHLHLAPTDAANPDTGLVTAAGDHFIYATAYRDGTLLSIRS
ncbi:hypothetical protein SAMN05660199_01151 [Klenkia soli]|uniref:Uncharacterized protein n=1 Tax=Klenkia soli TaxID=1052260 RepID=A0A1H0G6A8_9ACTN|nr:hypothetical protein [Klenkia soli]SDO02386.1 hypothetical protein SAMN05660199_01151 [Klenkia soli]